jgi:hypothetical protein
MSLQSALAASGPSVAVAGELQLFGRFIGEWHVQNSLFSESTGVWRDSELRWTFGWIIAGRGIQDVLVDASGTAVGTTVRTWDERAGWRVVWFCPRAAEHVVLRAIDEGDAISLEGQQADGRPVRWRFGDITPTSFTWDGWCSNDGGETWWHEQHMESHRANDAVTGGVR